MRRPSHGTTNMYSKHGCRCQPCVAANRAYQRAWQKKNPMYHTLYGQWYRSLPKAEE